MMGWHTALMCVYKVSLPVVALAPRHVLAPGILDATYEDWPTVDT